MGGDEPWDSRSMFYTLFGVEQYPEEEGAEPGELTKEIIETKLPAVWEEMKKKKGEEAVTIIDIQVLGVLILNAGAKFPQKVKEKVIECLQKDEWAEKSLERRIYVNEMIGIINEYDAKENPGPTQESLDYENVTDEDWMHPPLSGKLAKIAVEKFGEYCEAFPIIEEVTLGMDSNHGFNITLLINDDDEEEFLKFVRNKDFEWSGLFELPVRLVFTSDLTAKNKNK